MVGALPATRILLTRHGFVIGSFNNYSEIARVIGISVDMESGTITFNKEGQPPKYVVDDDGPISNNHWKSPDDIIRDWAFKHMKLPSGYRTYRYLV